MWPAGEGRVVEDRDRNMKDGVWEVFTSLSENCIWEQGSTQLSQVHRTPALPPQTSQGSTEPRVSRIISSPEFGGLGKATTGRQSRMLLFPRSGQPGIFIRKFVLNLFSWEKNSWLLDKRI